MPWWGWPEWERAIDKLAMQGCNMPLAATGMEAIWYQTLLRFGFTDLEARSFLSCARALAVAIDAEPGVCVGHNHHLSVLANTDGQGFASFDFDLRPFVVGAPAERRFGLLCGLGKDGDAGVVGGGVLDSQRLRAGPAVEFRTCAST